MSRILDPKFKYVPAANTDIRLTWARERRRLAAEARAKKRAAKEAETTPHIVLPIGVRRKA